MRMIVFCISFLLIQQAVATIPECPTQPNRSECLRVAQANYIERLEFLEQDKGYRFDDRGENFLMAANDIKYFETRACQQTCVN